MCEHEWRGDAEGVVCIKCGKRLTANEFIKLSSDSDGTNLVTEQPIIAEEKPKRGRKAKHE